MTSPVVVVVIPAYRVADRIASVVARMPAAVRDVIVVDDRSPDALDDALARITDPRLVVVRHDVNRGVGAAMKTGFRLALERGADIVIKIDGDGQMDPALVPQFVAPLAAGTCDLAKGNRFARLGRARRMPWLRRIGNLALSFLVKGASGYWQAFDPTNGYIAIRGDVLRLIDEDQLADRYFFEISLLCEAYLARAVLTEVPMTPVYDGEASSLHPGAAAVDFTPRLVARTARRVLLTYFMRDFTVVSICLLTGVPAVGFGVAWSSAAWLASLRSGVPATTGTVMLGVLPIVLGFQLLLQAVVLDVGNQPRRSP